MDDLAEFTWLDNEVTREVRDEVIGLLIDAVCYDGGHHKQYYAYNALRKLGVIIPDDIDPGCP